jgi:PAS domain-containing protein
VSARNLELASFLKSRRRRLTPEEVGLPHGTRRRIATLRREDVAWLADVGITWYTWLEQGRPIRMAAGTLERIGGALRLDASESEYLHKLVEAAHMGPPARDAIVADRIAALVTSYTGGYAFVTDARWDVLVWNERFGELFDLSADGPSLERNGLWIMFTHALTRTLFPDWDGTARRMVAMLRVEYAGDENDVAYVELIAALSARSPEFRAIWSNVEVFSPMKWSVGELWDAASRSFQRFQTVRLSIPDSPGQTLVFYVPDPMR